MPEKYLRGLDCVVLTNEDALSRKQRLGTLKSRKRRVRKTRVRGLYHGAWQGRPPWIEIRVDKTVSLLPKILTWIPLFRELCLGEVVYHELGHHIHACVRPEHIEKEDVADSWSHKLMGSFMRQHYWWLFRPVSLLFRVRRVLGRRYFAVNTRK